MLKKKSNAPPAGQGAPLPAEQKGHQGHPVPFQARQTRKYLYELKVKQLFKRPAV